MLRLSILILCSSLFFVHLLNAQSLEELNAQKAALSGEIGKLQTEVSAIEAQIARDFPDYGWKLKSFGTIGFNSSRFNNWVTVALPEVQNTTIMASFNILANLSEEKYFWNNALNSNLGWQRLIRDNDNPDEGERDFNRIADVLNFNSLFGYKINNTLAASAMTEYRTNLLSNFNDPGYLDIGIGATWKPVSNLTAVFHPLNYQYIFQREGGDFQSSLGCKIVADYVATIANGINWRSNVTSFVSYKDLNELSNFTWTNGFSFTAFKGIGVGIEYAMRLNKQETQAFASEQDFQSYFILGLTYAL
jgi:hypothetical protein